jgi:hypothetical protein
MGQYNDGDTHCCLDMYNYLNKIIIHIKIDIFTKRSQKHLKNITQYKGSPRALSTCL